MLPKDPNGCPFLILAPMEGVGDRCFRKAMASIGGFDEAVRDFLRVPANAHIKSLGSEYHSDELVLCKLNSCTLGCSESSRGCDAAKGGSIPSPIQPPLAASQPRGFDAAESCKNLAYRAPGHIPLAAQLMGSDPHLMAEMAKEMEIRGAHRIDLNCGCPSNKVTGRGAGSSLLKEPDFLHEIAKAMVKAVSIPVTIKMRSGYEDTSLFKENLLAAQESGVRYITLHPRTKLDGYGPPARWDLIAEAKSILKIPLVGNGDILNVKDALEMLRITGCDALMIGRGSVINPFIFHQIRSHFSKQPYQPKWEDLVGYLEVYLADVKVLISEKVKVNKLKQLMSFLFKGNEALLEMRSAILTSQYLTPASFMEFALPLLRQGWEDF